MKRALAAFICLILCAGVSVYNSCLMQNKSAELANMLDAVLAKYDENRPSAVSDFDRFEKTLQQLEGYLCISLNHDELDLVHEASSKVRAYMEAEKDADFKAEFANLYRLVKHLAKLEGITLENLL